MVCIVRKYGGSSVATSQQIKNIAMQLSELHRKSHSIIVVVSAMGTSTDQLVDLAYQVSSKPNRRELDMLLSAGERITMSLLSMALHDLGTPAISFTGSQSGVMTTASHSDAKISDIRPIRVVEALDSNKVVVLAGFQGVNPNTKEITTLGRGGSDTTAVAMAAHFKAKRCEILKDVDGVFSADPFKVATAQVLTEISYDAMIEICFWGSSVLHLRAIELAKKLNVPLTVGSTVDPSKHTRIVQESHMYEEGKILSINSHDQVHHFWVPAHSSAEAFTTWTQFIDALELPVPQILASVYDYEKRGLRLMCCGENESLTAIDKASQNSDRVQSLNLILSSVTLTGEKSISTHLLERVSATLGDHGIGVEKTIQSPLSLTLFINPKHQAVALNELHCFTK